VKNNDRSPANVLLGVGLLAFTVWSLNSPLVKNYYAAHGINEAGLYLAGLFRTIVAGALILGRGHQLVMALRLGVVAGALGFALLPANEKILAYALSVMVFAGVLMLLRASDQIGQGTRYNAAKKPLSPGEIACYALAGIFALASIPYAVAYGLRSGLLQYSSSTAGIEQLFVPMPIDSIEAIGGIYLIGAALLCLRPAQRVMTGLLCLACIGLAIAQFLADRRDFMLFHLATALLAGGLYLALSFDQAAISRRRAW
jgi:hypothetical protein